GVEHDALAALEPHLALGERADTQLRALEIGQNGDRAIFILQLAQRRNVSSKILVARMAHIDAEHIRSSKEQTLHDSRIPRCGPERRDDFNLTLPLHRLFVPGAATEAA